MFQAVIRTLSKAVNIFSKLWTHKIGHGLPLPSTLLKEIYEDPHVRFLAEAWGDGAEDLYPEP